MKNNYNNFLPNLKNKMIFLRKIIFLIFTLFIYCGLSFAAFDKVEELESISSEIESKSSNLKIDAKNHINSIQQKISNISKANFKNHDLLIKEITSVKSQTFELIEKTRRLKSQSELFLENNYKKNSIIIFGKIDGKESIFTRLSIINRELNCIEFSLYLMTNDEGSKPNESLNLSNYVLNSCQKINYGTEFESSLKTIDTNRKK